MFKQSSPAFNTVWKRGESKRRPKAEVGIASLRTALSLKKNWGHARPAELASNVKGAVMACGGLSLRAPVGGFAKGTPRKLSTMPDWPMIVALGMGITTVGEAARAAGAAMASGRRLRRTRNCITAAGVV
jgi:hypothetical protein